MSTSMVQHRLVPVVDADKWGHGNALDEHVHPTARQYDVRRYGSSIGRLFKWWYPSPCAGCQGGWEWVFEPRLDPDDHRSWPTLKEAKKALRVER